MRTTKFNKPLPHWRPRRRSLFITLFIICIIGFVVALPWLMRTNGAFIDQQIQASRSLPDSKREETLTQLLRASGGDGRVGEELASFYRDQYRYSAAASIYTKTRPQQWLKAAELFARQYDYAAVERAATQATSTSPEGYTWLSRALLNQNMIDQGCKGIDKVPSGQQNDLTTACTLARQSSLSRSDIYRLRDLGAPVLAAERLASLKQKTTADWLFLSDVAWRQENYNQFANDIELAFQQDPWNRDVLISIQNACKSQSNNEINIKSVCEKHGEVATKNLTLLLQ